MNLDYNTLVDQNTAQRNTETQNRIDVMNLRNLSQGMNLNRGKGLFGTGIQTMFHGTSPESAQNIKAKGFQPSAPKGGFNTTWADAFQKGAKTFVSNPNVANTYGSTKIPIATSAGNLTSPIGGGITKSSVALGPERVLTPGQATKGMNLIEKAKQYSNSPTAKKLLAGKTLGNVAKTALGRANLPLTVGTTAFDIGMQLPAVQKYGTKLGEGLYGLLNPATADQPSDMPQGSPNQLSQREQAQKYLNENKLDPAAGYQDYLDPERSYQRQLQSLIDGTNNQSMDAYQEGLKQARGKISTEFDDYLNQQGYQKYLSDREIYQSAPAIMERENKLKEELNRLAALDTDVAEDFGFANILNDPNYRKEITGYTVDRERGQTPVYRNLSPEALQEKLSGSLENVFNQYGVFNNQFRKDPLTSGQYSTLRNQLEDLTKYGNVDPKYSERINYIMPESFSNIEDIRRRLDPNRARFDSSDPSKQFDYGNLKFKDNYSLSMPSKFYKDILDKSQGLPSQFQGYGKNLLKQLQGRGLATGGRAGYYTGGMVDVEPNLSDIGHGSDGS
jgi:hypothetical protein